MRFVSIDEIVVKTYVVGVDGVIVIRFVVDDRRLTRHPHFAASTSSATTERTWLQSDLSYGSSKKKKNLAN